MPSRIDKEQTHGRKPGKGGSSSARGSTSKGVTSTQAHDASHSPKHSTISAPKQQNTTVRSTSPTSDKQQEQSKPKSKSPPNSTEHSIRSSCLLINNII